MLHFLGLVMLIIGGVMLIPAAIAPILGEAILMPVFIIPALIALSIGYYIRKTAKPRELSLGEAMVTATLSWIIFAGFASVPFIGGIAMPIEDAYFESMSGLTATGLTMIPQDPVATHLVISEVGISSDNVSYIELYNPTAASIEASELYIWIAYPGEEPVLKSVELYTSFIRSHGYFLIASSRSVNGIGADAVSVFSWSPAGAVAVGLEHPDHIIDRLAWGGELVENFAEGRSVPHSLLVGASIERQVSAALLPDQLLASEWGNAYDTDTNSSDFVFHQNLIDPENSSFSKPPLLNIERTPKTILFWRSLTEWVGGLGIIVLFLTALVGFGKAARKMYVAEARTQFVEPNVTQTARSLWGIYITLTLVGAALLYIAALPNASVFESINHAMTGIATGGFSVRNDSFASYEWPVLGVTVVIMIAGATSFAVHRLVFRGLWREFYRNVEVKFMLVLIVLFSLILAFSVDVADSIFQTTSALTGTGFSTSDLKHWGDGQKGALILLMVIGGGYGSTSSALKLIRVLILAKAIHWMIKKSFLPERAVVPMKLGGRIYTEHEMMEAAIYAFLYLLVMIGGAVVLMSLGYPAIDSLFESASAQGNVGLSVGIASPFLPIAGKITMILQMLIGRLEIIPVIALFGYLVSEVPRSVRRASLV
jgi:trk system potassium uptake protein TrkH